MFISSRSDLNTIDKMNVTAALNLCSEKTEDLIAKLPETIALRLFIRIKRYPVEAFSFNEMDDITRIKKIWYAVFLCRGWKLSNLSTDFMTLPSYLALELNAHSILQLHEYCRRQKRPDLFIPPLLNSQVCESQFRYMRSLSGQQSNNINFNIFGALNRCRRIEAIGILERILLTKGMF